MQVRGVNIDVVSVPGTEDPNTVPLDGYALVKVQDPFRQRVRTMFERAHQRGINEFELSGVDNRYPDIPIVGAAKITAQETLRAVKKSGHPFKTITIQVPGDHTRALFQKTLEGYIHHIENDLGEEPYYTVDLIIEMPQGIVLIERSNPPYGWALPGGFIDPGEEPKEAAVREAKEETNLEVVQVRSFAVYGQPGRDPRFRTISTVFIATGAGEAQFGDDAKGLKIIPYPQLLNGHYAFDHHQIIKDYLAQKNPRPA
jgi:ADP-ribose pyrophosphatase YjhB (NUDIX family)